jgi:hypothetical protein
MITHFTQKKRRLLRYNQKGVKQQPRGEYSGEKHEKPE